MKAYWGSGGSPTHSLTSALDGSEWPASRPGHFTPRERAPGTQWLGGWVGSVFVYMYVYIFFTYVYM
jgi:hypothetical protein